MRRIISALAAVLVIAGLAVTAISFSPERVTATPYANDQTSYELLGRVFPDPHGCLEGPTASPFAKGTACATDFMQHEEMVRGFRYLEELFPKYTKLYQLNKDFKCNGRPVKGDEKGCGKFMSAGLPVTTDENGETFVRERRRLTLFRVTDEKSPIPLKKRKWFAFPLSIHGIERAGVEGGVRAAEDLATWAACQADKAPDFVDCEAEASDDPDMPYPLMEASPNKSISAGEAMKKSVVVMIFPNPDGWLRGDRLRDTVPGSSHYQRYNGNGVDVNRDWPTQGWTFRPYTPASEPETKALAKVLPAMGPKDKNGNAKWAGGIDLHGQLVDRAFSFTLLGAGEHDYGKNQRIVQLVKEAYLDAENRLDYSPFIKPNDCGEAPVDPTRPECQGIYGVQWGTIWDTIDYTITGGFGDWINNPIGLNGDGIDNEMSASHLANCGIGTCFDPDIEQLHVDGNKSLIYGMVNFTLKKEDKTFETKGRVAYLKNKGFIKGERDRFVPPPKFTKFPQQEDIIDETLDSSNGHTYEFTVKGPKDKIYNGGIEASLTCMTFGSQGQNCESTSAFLERLGGQDSENPGEWETVNSYFLQGPGYAATGKALHANLPTAGQWRVRLVETTPADMFDLDIFFSKEKAWDDPGQLPYKVTSMKFWKDLKKFSKPEVEGISETEIKKTSSWKKRYDTIVITNRVYDDLAGKLKSWVDKQDGNLVLLDKAVGMVDKMGLVNGGVGVTNEYAGYINFETSQAEDTTGSYGHPSGLAKDVNQPGSAEGGQGETDELDENENHRHQTYEPVPLGIAIEDGAGNDSPNSPVWYLESTEVQAANGEPVGTTGDFTNVSLGQIKHKGGVVKWIGALLPDPSEKFDHPFGLNNHALTYSGYQLLHNALKYEK